MGLIYHQEHRNEGKVLPMCAIEWIFMELSFFMRKGGVWLWRDQSFLRYSKWGQKLLDSKRGENFLGGPRGDRSFLSGKRVAKIFLLKRGWPGKIDDLPSKTDDPPSP